MSKYLLMLALVMTASSCRIIQKDSATKQDNTSAPAATAYKIAAQMTNDLTGFSIIGLDLNSIVLTAVTADGSFTQGQGAIAVTMPRFKITFTAVDNAAKSPLSCEIYLPLAFVRTNPMPVVDTAACKASS